MTAGKTFSGYLFYESTERIAVRSDGSVLG